MMVQIVEGCALHICYKNEMVNKTKKNHDPVF